MKSRKTFVLFLLFFTFFHNYIISQDDVWQRIQPTPQEHSLYCVRQIPGTETIVAVGDGSTIMYSDDEGETWDITLNPAGLQNNTQFRSVNFIDEDNGYAADYFGRIIRTTNCGQNWNLVYNKTHDSLRTDRVDIYLFDAETAIVVGWDQLILKTKDGGDSWTTTVSPEGFFPNSIDFINQDTGYIVGNPDSSMILRTYNGGDDWFSQPFINGFSGNFFDIGFVSDSVGFINYNSSNYRGDDTTYIFKTVDKGIHWSLNYKVSSFLSIGELSIMDQSNIISFAYNWGLSNIVTHNQGLSWEEIFGPFSGSWSSGNSILYTSEYIMSVGIYGRAYKTTDMIDWISLSHNTRFDKCRNVQFTSEQTAYMQYTTRGGGLLNGYLMKSNDGGHNWNEIMNWAYEGNFDFINDNYGFVARNFPGDGLKLYQTSNGGNSWNEFYTFGEVDIYLDLPVTVKFLDSLNGIVAWLNESYITNDGGVSWNNLLIFETDWDEFFNAAYLSEDTILMGCLAHNRPAVFKSVDGGATFEADTLDQKSFVTMNMYFKNHSTGFVLANRHENDSGFIYKTVDAGETWYPVTINDTSSSTYNNIFFGDDETGYVVGSGAYTTVLKSTDGGETWDPIDIPCSSGLSQVYFHDEWHGFVFGNGGVIMETFTGGVVGMEENPFVVNKPFFSISPNPSRDNVQIKLNEPIEDVLIIEFYNINGDRIIHNLEAGIIGKNDISINLISLPPGLYFCRISNGNNVSTRKVVKL